VKVSSLASNSQKNDLPLLPIIAVIIILAVFVGGWVIYLRRNKK
jgi:predicted permease